MQRLRPPPELIELLSRSDARSNTLVVVGAGVSIATVADGTVTLNRARQRIPKRQSDLASWSGLLLDGIQHCLDVSRQSSDPLTDEWAEPLRAQVNSGRPTSVLPAAKAVTDELKRFRAYAGWIEETIGALTAEDPRAIKALHRLGLPLATTNYDGLIEHITGRSAIHWRQDDALQRLGSGDLSCVVHLHGFWKDRESLVLSSDDYRDVERELGAQILRHTLAGTKKLLFVGCGAGLSDPNFGQLLGYIRELGTRWEYKPYRLVTTEESKKPSMDEGATLRLADYGDHANLGPYLERLAPSGQAIPSGGGSSGSPPSVEAEPDGISEATELEDVATTILQLSDPLALARAADYLVRAEQTYQALNRPENRARCVRKLGDVARARWLAAEVGDTRDRAFVEAVSQFERARVLFAALRDDAGVLHCLGALAALNGASGRAQKLLGLAIDLYRARGRGVEAGECQAALDGIRTRG